MIYKQRSGQALLLVLLSVGVILTVGLSVVARSVTDISTTKSGEDSLRAFSAAEAGVEESLKAPIALLPTNAPISTDVSIGSNTTYTSSSKSLPEDPSSYIYPVELLSGDTATIWLASHNSNNTLTCASGATCYKATTINLCWGKLGISASQQPSLLVSVLYQDPVNSNIKNAVMTYDPDSNRRSRNHFSSNVTTDTTNGACTISQTKFANRSTLDFSSLGISNAAITGGYLRGLILRGFYNQAATVVGVTAASGGTLPLQGRKIESTGLSGEATRKVQVFAIYPEIPSIFHSVVYSPPGIIKTP